MTQITLNIEDAKILPALKKIIGALNGVSIAKTHRKTNYEIACEDIDKGRLTEYTSVDEAFKDLNISL